MRVLLACTHNVPEPAGALALAGALAEQDRHHGRRIAVIQTGGNIDASMLRIILDGGTPAV